VARILNKIGYASPIVIVSGLYVTYMAAPEFYLSYILEEAHREQGAVEIVTFLSALIARLMLSYSTWQLWQGGNWLAAVVVGAVSAATLVFAGEEIGWGQILLGWETPSWWKENFGGSTDLHGARFPVPHLAAVFLLVIFFLLPLAWKFQSPLRLPVALEPAIAEGPVIFTIALAAIYRELKGVYFWLSPFGDQNHFYKDYFWGLNEHKEMLIAIAMLMYALYRLPIFKQILPRS
jgi:hypothetical protein